MKNWVPGFPRSRSITTNVMLQVMSDIYFYNEDGLVNAPKEAIGYPLCRYNAGKYMTVLFGA